MWRRRGAEPLCCCCCCRLIVVHDCKGNGEVPLVWWWWWRLRCVCSSGCGPRWCGHWLMRLPSCGRWVPFTDNETTSTQKNSHTIRPAATTQKHNTAFGSSTAPSCVLRCVFARELTGRSSTGGVRPMFQVKSLAHTAIRKLKY